ncbi:DUF1129 family protein [Oceanobacillus sp. Castelsardo]|uniref:DUF1129 family protein n=1 Tax=Oceanobacillus sp. Castelsardo TaxID=1851204 RepID=UPI000837F781|nr:DUF1129 family protein [Oceanobacillus sp. Castelsardo]
MNAKDIIKLNNEKREQLSESNKTYYEDMLMYIRLNTNKSEQQTEEVLLELLEHLLEADNNGQTAKDVFGEDLKAYCNELISEIPGEKTSKNVSFIAFLILDLIAIVSIFQGVVGYGLYLFGLGSKYFSFPIGSGLVIVIIDLIILAIWIIVILKWLKNSSFKEKKPKKWVEFLQIWLICMAFIGLSVGVFIVMPDFGNTVNIHLLAVAIIGVVLYIVKIIINNKYRITK